ncbi:GD17881 [Drosophila simulans]|uniref:GD17881 n=1 Tax=Drosophila simulans TaxID=7240 RepID=B4QAJ8_DROSI|nr:GD17881 [Drosophila simulans]
MRGWLPLSFAVAAHFKFAAVQSPNSRYRYQHQQHREILLHLLVFIAVVILNSNSPIWADFR